jgi:hypothetical protein
MTGVLEIEEGTAEVLNNCGGNFVTAEYSMNYLGICIIMLKVFSSAKALTFPQNTGVY